MDFIVVLSLLPDAVSLGSKYEPVCGLHDLKDSLVGITACICYPGVRDC